MVSSSYLTHLHHDFTTCIVDSIYNLPNHSQFVLIEIFVIIFLLILTGELTAKLRIVFLDFLKSN